MIKKRTFAVVGTGLRIPMFIYPIADTYRETCELVGMCDPSETRRVFHQRRLDDLFAVGLVPTYSDFDEMLRACQPDVVIVCTPDYLHHEFIVKSLEFGADVISEKPLTTDASKCQEIFDAVKRTGRSVRTTFNLRWTPGATKDTLPQIYRHSRGQRRPVPTRSRRGKGCLCPRAVSRRGEGNRLYPGSERFPGRDRH
ncbi:MAG: Gfo/Idh/MocA family oxidoreductase [Verrucomicrobia bacterium]|nr:Gfo/Idh/MocA family oxidoreductase [Verrucomicrobiota bacterium]